MNILSFCFLSQITVPSKILWTPSLSFCIHESDVKRLFDAHSPLPPQWLLMYFILHILDKYFEFMLLLFNYEVQLNFVDESGKKK